jgi:hypothetical protein
VNGNEQSLALVPIAASVDVAEQLLVYETAAAKALRISIREFRRLVDLSVIPFRLHSGRKKRLYYMEDLRAYAKSLEPRYVQKTAASLPSQSAESSHRHWGPKTHTEPGDDEHWVTG